MVNYVIHVAIRCAVAVVRVFGFRCGGRMSVVSCGRVGERTDVAANGTARGGLVIKIFGQNHVNGTEGRVCGERKGETYRTCSSSRCGISERLAMLRCSVWV